METTLTKSDILEHERKLYNAIKKSDIGALSELLHDDLLFIIPGGTVITKEMDLKTYRDGSLKIDEVLPTFEHLSIIDDLAVLTLTLELKGKSNNVPFEVSYRYIRFWKRFGEGIKVVGGSGTAI